MTRPVWLRVFTCLWAIWFGGVLIEPELQPCPMHHAHAMVMDGMQMPASGGHHGGNGHNSSAPCTCLGACCSAPSVALPTVTVAVVPAPRTVVQSRYTPRDERAPASAPRHAHPFANGPPSGLAA